VINGGLLTRLAAAAYTLLQKSGLKRIYVAGVVKRAGFGRQRRAAGVSVCLSLLLREEEDLLQVPALFPLFFLHCLPMVLSFIPCLFSQPDSFYFTLLFIPTFTFYTIYNLYLLYTERFCICYFLIFSF
jgi:hypothetical protein